MSTGTAATSLALRPNARVDNNTVFPSIPVPHALEQFMSHFIKPGKVYNNDAKFCYIF